MLLLNSKYKDFDVFTKTKITIALATLLLPLSSFAEDVTVTLGYPTSTYGLGVLEAQKANMDTCSIFVDSVVKASGKSTASFKLKPGTYNFNVSCYSPAENGLRQTYFGSDVKSQKILAGQDNNVDIDLKVADPKKVSVTIDSPHVSPGNWKITYLNGDSKQITLDANDSFTDHFWDENPPYSISATNGIEIGILSFTKYSFNLMPTKTVGVVDSDVATGINATLSDGGYIYNESIGLVINDKIDQNSVANITVKNVLSGNYEVRITDENNVKVYPEGEISSDSNINYTFSSTNNLLTLSGTVTLKINFSGMDTTKKYKLFLLPIGNNLP